ncbi:MAG: hypothetical protein ACLPUO_18545 [Streptosporangiaceae bacterium]|jgi:hypothetical protein
MPQCVTCGRELHPERAKKYNYCLERECQEKNARGLTMVAIGVNKSAEQYMILDDKTREELASGKYHDQRRGSFGTPAQPVRAKPGTSAADTSAAGASATDASAACAAAARRRAPAPSRSQARTATRRPWSRSQEKLALLYNEQRMRPDEIARKLGLSAYTVSQIILSARNQGKL